MLCLNSSADRGEICRSQFPCPDAPILHLTTRGSVRRWAPSSHSSKYNSLPLHRGLSTSQDWEVCPVMIFFGAHNWWICLFNDYHFHFWLLFSQASFHEQMSNGENYLPSPVMCSLELPGEPFPVLYGFLSKWQEMNEITLTLLYNSNTKEDCCQWTLVGNLQFLFCELQQQLTAECCRNITSLLSGAWCASVVKQ